MIIDINYYYSRWLINYIIYHGSHLRANGELEAAQSLFSASYWKNMEKLKFADMEAEIAAIQANMQQQGWTSAEALKIISDLQQGNLLETTMNEIANSFNQSFDSLSSSLAYKDYDTIIQEARTYSNLLEAAPDINRVNEFFTMVAQSLSQMKALNSNILDGLSNIGQRLIGTSFQLNTNNQNLVLANNADVQTAQKVLNLLSNAVSKFETSGSVSSRSFSQTISRIFRKALGDKMAESLIATGLQDAEEQINSILDQAIAESKGNLKWVNRGKAAALKNINNAVSVFNNGTFQMRIAKSGKVFNIELSTHAETVDWSANPANNIQLVNTQSMGDYFQNKDERYLAYNMIAHRYTDMEFEEAVDTIRASTAASFFNQWINGRGLQMPSGETAQFLIIENKVYPVLRIISNICDEIMRGETSEAFDFGMNRSGFNKWQGKNGPNLPDALKRSQMVNEIINKFTIQATLNNNILAQYAY